MFVLDASSAINIARGTDLGNAFMAFLSDDSNQDVIAPELFRAEVMSSAWKYVHARVCPKEIAYEIAMRSIGLVTKYYSLEDLQKEAFNVAAQLDHSPYDIFYLVLARRTGATLMTADKKLQSLCEQEGIDCIHEIDC